MKRNIYFFILCLLFTFPHSAKSQGHLHRGLFVTVLQEPVAFSSREGIDQLINFSKKVEIEILFVQIYRANKAWFPSQVGDSAPYEEDVKKFGEDPLSVLIKKAHASGIQVHAWINLLSLSGNADAKLLKKYGTEILTQNLKEKKTLEDYKIDNQYFLEPGDLRVREELSNMVEEIARAYPDLDGVQFDYIRYPDKNPHYGYTKMNMERFKRATGQEKIDEDSLIWKDWKRAQVTELLEVLIQKIRAIRPDIQISTTGCMPYSRAYHEAFQDWPSWLQRGLVNFVTLMCYVRNTLEFEKYLLDAKTKAGDFFNKINIAVDAYDLSGSPKTFVQQFNFCEQTNSRACVVFHYGSLLEHSSLVQPLVNASQRRT